MSQIVLSSNVSGTAQFTIAAPGTNNDRTVTLPDATGVLVLDNAVQTLSNKTIQGGTITLATAQASTSGTSIDFTGIPSWVKRITVMFDGVSTSGADNILIRTGSGSFDASGYLNSGSYLGTSTVSTVNATTGYVVQNGGASSVISGCLNIVMLRANSWTASGVFGFSNTAAMSITAGARGTSGALDRIRITTTGGTDTFDAGTINISWE